MECRQRPCRLGPRLWTAAVPANTPQSPWSALRTTYPVCLPIRQVPALLAASVSEDNGRTQNSMTRLSFLLVSKNGYASMTSSCSSIFLLKFVALRRPNHHNLPLWNGMNSTSMQLTHTVWVGRKVESFIPQGTEFSTWCSSIRSQFTFCTHCWRGGCS